MNEGKLSFAYGCFLTLGLCFVLLVLGEVATPRGETGGFKIIQYVWIPLSLPALVAAILGIGFTIRFWREWPLVLLSVILLSVILVFVIGNPDGSLAAVYFLIATGAFLLFPPRWFLFVRKRRA